MASLRARLLAGVLGLTAIGLLTLGGITYAEQRSFLYERIDRQVRSAPAALARALGERGIGPAPLERSSPGAAPGAPGAAPPPRGGAPGNFDLPPGTYGQRRDASGRVLGSTVLDYGQGIVARPALPARITPGRLLTVGGRAGDGSRYRVLAQPDPGGRGTVVVAVPLREVDQTLHRLLLVEALVIGAVLLVLAAVGRYVVRVGLLPLDRIGRTAGAIAGGDLSHRVEPADPRTEVGRLGLALNGMLERLERAFAERRDSENRLRRFLADASHELRTPLASIRGYAELHRMGATREPAEVERSMRRIEDEAARMGVLVEDLLTLARLDQMPEAPHGEVDVAALARDAVDDARATAPDRAIAIEAPAHATVLGDAHQLRQVLANLLRNALVHTAEGTAIDVSVAERDGGLCIEVRDHGHGLPAGDPQLLFERFWRTEEGRERGRAGAGLGLAIVAALVDAHGGRVHAADAPGGGAAFVVELPGERREDAPR